MKDSKTIFITGAGTGLGRDTAFALARRGHHVIATCETDEQSAMLLADADKHTIQIRAFKLDITVPSDRLKVADFEPDVFINNAGIGESGSLAEISMNKVRHNFEVNVFSTFEVTQLALRGMLERDHGTILIVSSLLGRITMPFLAPYSMTKFALSAGAEALRSEIHRVRRNVHISLIEPGAYATGFNQFNIAKKHKWMDETSIFHPIIDRLRKEEELRFRLIEPRTTTGIVRKIIKAAEARRPRLRYSAPWWQAAGVQILRMVGK